jgi:hypothetical protein
MAVAVFRPDAGNLGYSLALFACFKDCIDPLVECPNALIDLEHECIQLVMISRMRSESASLGSESICGIRRLARLAATPIAIPRSWRSPRIWLINAVRRFTNR